MRLFNIVHSYSFPLSIHIEYHFFFLSILRCSMPKTFSKINYYVSFLKNWRFPTVFTEEMLLIFLYTILIFMVRCSTSATIFGFPSKTFTLSKLQKNWVMMFQIFLKCISISTALRFFLFLFFEGRSEFKKFLNLLIWKFLTFTCFFYVWWCKKKKKEKD